MEVIDKKESHAELLSCGEARNGLI